MRYGLLAVAGTMVASFAQAQSWQTVDVSRQVRDTGEHRIRVQYAAGRFSMRPTSDPVLYSMQLRYDEDRARPIHRYDADWRSATLGLETESLRMRNLKDGDFGEMQVSFSNVVPLDLELKLGATESRIDLGGLTVNRLRVETGAADAVLDFSTPNRTRMRRLDVTLGAAGFSMKNLGNANASSIRVNGAVGDVQLDFGSVIRDDVGIDAEVAIGHLGLRLPSDVGVRVEVQKLIASFDHAGLRKRGDAYYSDNWDSAAVRVRVRAQTVFGAIDIDRTR
jgi:hypothetical protein